MGTFASMDTIWVYTTHTAPIPVTPNPSNGTDMHWRSRVSHNYCGTCFKFCYFPHHNLSNHHSMQEALSTCISVCSVIVIIVSTILVLLLSISLVLVKNTVLTKKFRSHITMVKKIKESQWEHEPSNCWHTVYIYNRHSQIIYTQLVSQLQPTRTQAWPQP